MIFEEKIRVLNEQQHQAVQAIEGPVMVIAGPGTGKTEILSLRIGQILNTTDAAAGNILCLTYTEAAATEMRQRLIEYIGPEAYRIHVSTFHSFCNLVIQENPALFQQSRELEPISDIDKFQLIQALIDQFPPDHPLKRFKGNTYTDWKRLDELFTTMKKENWSPGYMYDRIDEYISRKESGDEFRYKVTRKNFTAGDLKPEFKTKVLDRMEVLRAAVSEYDHYNALLAERGQYDFDDMLLWVYTAFDTNPDLLANYQERFLYILVDEFQDTNGIQIDILKKLIDHEWVDRPNVFVVGDDDQAIYRFQGANIENLKAFYDGYQPEIIFLDKNYRSSQLILDTSLGVMSPVENRLLAEIFNQVKTLDASGPYAQLPQQVILQVYPSLSYENAAIFQQLKLWHEQHTGGDIAVLYPKHELGRELAQALRGAGIPFHVQKKSNTLQQPLIEHLLIILQCIHQLSQGQAPEDALLYQTLHLRYLEPETIDLQRMMLAYTDLPAAESSSFFVYMGDRNLQAGLSLKNPAWIERINQLLQQAIVEYHSGTLITFVEWVVHEFGLLKWVMHQPEQFIHLNTLKTFYTFVENQASGQPSFKVPDLLALTELMTTYGISLPVHELIHAGKGIHLSSLHGAKGLEFDKVIIKNLTDNEWEKKRAPTQSFTYPDNLVRKDKLSLTTSEEKTKDYDRRRLLYVGMTRAKQELMLTYATGNDEGKGFVPSVYLTEMEKSSPGLQRLKAEPDVTVLNEYLVAFMSGERKADLWKDEAIIRDRVKNFVLNVSALNTYLECPLKFYYEKILVVPAAENMYMLFGSALHSALERFFTRRFAERDSSIGKAYLIRMFEIFMENKKHRFTPKQFDDLTTYGRKIFDAYYDQYQSTWSDAIQYEIEYRIKDIHIAGIPVKGFIDRIDKKGLDLEIVDYKSGKPENISGKLKPISEKEPVGGNYWRQMVFYDLMIRQDGRLKGEPARGIIQAIEPKKDGSFFQKELVVSEEDREVVTQQITDTWHKIQNMEFEKGCGECAWCKMHDLDPPRMGGEENEVERED